MVVEWAASLNVSSNASGCFALIAGSTRPYLQTKDTFDCQALNFIRLFVMEANFDRSSRCNYLYPNVVLLHVAFLVPSGSFPLTFRPRPPQCRR